LNALIFDIRRYTIHDGPGIRTTVFFKGCPLRCWWCHNPESQEVGVEKVAMQRFIDGKCFEVELAVGSWQSAEDVMKEIEKDSVFYQESGGGVTFSGGEPLLQAEALKELLYFCREKGCHTAIDTSGHAEPAAVKQVMGLADLWLFDLKLMDDIKHLEYTGVSNELALKNLEMLSREGKEIIVRFPVIPGITDNKDNLGAIVTLMKRLHLNRIDLLPYHDIARDKYRRMRKEYLPGEILSPSMERMNEIMAFFVENDIIVKV
jgi:pyruvate formate lyase activating enzyme